MGQPNLAQRSLIMEPSSNKMFPLSMGQPDLAVESLIKELSSKNKSSYLV